MTFKDMRRGLGEFWSEFRKVKSGIVGLVLFAFFLILVIFEPLLVPFPEASSRWNDMAYWQDNPSGVPPAWMNAFTDQKRAISVRDENAHITENEITRGRMYEVVYSYDYQYDVAPRDMIFHLVGDGTAQVMLTMTRPDGINVILMRSTTVRLSEGINVRLSLDNDTRDNAFRFGTTHEDRAVSGRLTQQLIRPTDVYFSKAQFGIMNRPEALKGTYTFTAQVFFSSDQSRLDESFYVVAGRVSGFLGTDIRKRDIWSGIVAGTKWALLIGMLTALMAVGIGVIYGVMGAYLGGWKDALMQRIFEIFLSIPILPILIVLSAVFRPSIWILILLMSMFFWTGPVKTVRSIGLQIKEETFIEASKALGASSWRLIFKHMIPLLIPYSFASMALYIPQAIVFEASVSLLGLGDRTIVTWGQILQDAWRSGAVLNSQWWWVVPPGMFVAIMGMTFAFIGFAMDKILHPKLRTR